MEKMSGHSFHTLAILEILKSMEFTLRRICHQTANIDTNPSIRITLAKTEQIITSLNAN